MHAMFNEVKFTDADVVNPDDAPYFTGCADYKPWLFHDHGFVLAVVFAETLQDALDTAADQGKLDRFKLDINDEHDRADYAAEVTVPKTGDKFWDWRDDAGVSHLGNYCHPYDIATVSIAELPNPPFSFVALFNAVQKEKV